MTKAAAMATKAFRVAVCSATALGCGARSDVLPADAGESAAGGSSGKAGTSGSLDACTAPAEKVTRPGPCAATELECGFSGSVDCGSCEEGDCYEGRCYRVEGARPGRRPPLMRSLDTAGEGQSFTITSDGIFESLEAALWTGGVDVGLRVIVRCNGKDVVARDIRIAGNEIPFYDGWQSDMRPVPVHIEPPLAVARGQTLDVMFRAFPPPPNRDFAGAVSGIQMQDVDPDSHFLSVRYGGISPELAADWDYMVALYVH